MYERLAKIIHTLNGRELIQWLIAHNEAITQRVAMRRLTIPTRLACFGTVEELVNQLNEEVPEANKASLASRFLIEYAATRPPSGIRPMSYTIYDELLAISSAIVNFGQDSDLVRYGIAEVRLNLLASGRIGIDLAEYSTGSEAYRILHSGAEMRHAESSFPRHWREPAPVSEDKASDLMAIDGAFLEEFGYSLTDFVSLINEMISLGLEDHHEAVYSQPAGTSLEHLRQAALGWPKGKGGRRYNGAHTSGRENPSFRAGASSST